MVQKDKFVILGTRWWFREYVQSGGFYGLTEFLQNISMNSV